jgi:hypothetical protein
VATIETRPGEPVAYRVREFVADDLVAMHRVA